MKKRQASKKVTPIENPSYESTHALKKLLLTVTIVNHGQEEAVIKFLKEHEAGLTLITHGYGTANPNSYSRILAEERKQVIFSIIRKEKWPSYKEQIEKRFSVSDYAKGIAFCIDITSVFGVFIYKMLTNTQALEKPNKSKQIKSPIRKRTSK